VFSAHTVSAFPSNECRVQPHPSWTEQEQWIWRQTCKGMEADLAKHYGGSYDSQKADKWPKQRTLTPQFLEALLFHDPWRSSIPRHGIDIRGAKFSESINLEHAFFQISLSLINCAIANLVMNEIQAKQGVTLKGTHLSEINLLGANIGGQLNLDDATVTGTLDMDAATVNQHMLLRRAHLTEINLLGANIGGQLSLDDATVTGKLGMDAATVKQNILLRKAHLTEINLLGATIGGQLSLDDATVTGKLGMDSINVKQSVFSQKSAAGGNNSSRCENWWSVEPG
jgi:uncharacterized protein YjbI with pentapeptide repeats